MLKKFIFIFNHIICCYTDTWLVRVVRSSNLLTSGIKFEPWKWKNLCWEWSSSKWVIQFLKSNVISRSKVNWILVVKDQKLSYVTIFENFDIVNVIVKHFSDITIFFFLVKTIDILLLEVILLKHLRSHGGHDFFNINYSIHTTQTWDHWLMKKTIYHFNKPCVNFSNIIIYN